MRSWILALSVLAPGCSLSMPLVSAEHVVDGKHAEVGSSDPDEAQRLARLADEIAPFLHAQIVDVRDEKLRVRVLEELPGEHFKGVTFQRESPRWVALARDPSSIDHTLGHEAVHFWLGATWDALPPIVEEGLCDMLSEAALGRPNAARRARKLVLLHTWNEGGFRLPLRYQLDLEGPIELLDQLTVLVTWNGRPSETPRVAEAIDGEAMLPSNAEESALRQWQAAIGEVLARRIGVDVLRELCERASTQGLERVPAVWILGAAGLHEGDTEAWKRAIGALDGEHVRRRIGASRRRAVREEDEVPL